MLPEQIALPAEWRLEVNIPSSEELPAEDGVPMESPWHRAAINLLLESIDYHWQDRTDYYAGGNMFIYFSRQQLRNLDYRGPDFFVVTGVDGSQERKSWVVWEEDGRYPDLIIELISPTSTLIDKQDKKQLYEQVFRTPEYYCYDPATEELLGWRLANGRYKPIEPDEQGRLWSNVLEAWLAPQEGRYIGHTAVWLRFFDREGRLILTYAEAAAARAEQEAARAEQEAVRAEQEATARQAAEAEVARLKEELARYKKG